ncbi:MAG: hypothetical protein HW399_364, partial [Dehalococcoidia bacterium]|nr:hypothetical protein [Dehalococcoidia bacterium]
SAFGGVIGLKVMRLLRFTRNDELQPIFILLGPDLPGWGLPRKYIECYYRILGRIEPINPV